MDELIEIKPIEVKPIEIKPIEPIEVKPTLTDGAFELKVNKTMVRNKDSKNLLKDIETIKATRNIDTVKERKLREKMRNG